MTSHLSRRDALALLAASAAVTSALPPQADAAAASSSLLPVKTPGLDHLDVIVPDVEKSTRFYMGLFRTTLHAQPFQGAQRYFVLLGPLPENRAVGYIAVGASRGRGTYIGHFCTSVQNWARDNAAIFAAMKERFAAEKFGEFPGGGGFGGIFQDPDGIEVQFLPAPDTLVTAAVPSDLVPGQQGLVVPKRVDHVIVRVSDLKRSLAFYRVLYGRESNSNRDSATFTFTNGTRLVLEQTRYVYGEARTRIARYGIRVEPFDRAAAEAKIVQLGGKVVAGASGSTLRLQDVDGLELELVPG